MAYEPALDGIRALSVVAVLLFHNGFDWMGGGFLGVSTFFTLSGFLITSLLVLEREQAGGIDLKRFWSRRFRRLLPASLVCLLLVLAVGAAVGTNTQQAALRGDILSSLAYVANWHFVLEGSSYAGIFEGGAESPAQHFWSLAIEEQFYLLFPLLVFVATKLLGRRRSSLLLVLGSLWVLSLSATLLYASFGWDNDRIYYGTETRALELLTGALLAMALAGRTKLADPRVRRVVVLAAPTVLAVMVVLWTATEVTTRWLHTGGFGLYSLLSAALIMAAVQPEGPIRALLSREPVQWVGRVSYGVYLYHWPIFMYLREATDLADWPRFLIACTITFTLAEGSYRFVELPIRSGQWPPRPRQALAAFPAAIVTVALLTAVVTADYRAAINFDTGVLDVDESKVPRAVDGAPRIGIYGDSTMLTLAEGIAPFLDSTPELRRSPGSAQLGCGIGRDGFRQYLDVPVRPVDPDCWDVPWAASIARDDPDVALVLVGPWDITDRWLPGEDPASDPARFPGDPTYDEYLLSEMLAAVDILSANGAVVVWLTSPQIELGMIDGRPPTVNEARAYVDAEGVRHYVASDPARGTRFNELVKELPQRRPGKVAVIDLAGHLASLPTGPVAPELRPDGVHFSSDGGAQQIVDEWLGAQILETVRGLDLAPPA